MKLRRTIRNCMIGGILAAGLTGCDTSDIQPVDGTVTYKGEPLPEGRVTFYPEEGRPAFGDIKDGEFQLTTYSFADGALPGRHRVTIQWDELSNPDDAFSDQVRLIPERYFNADTSGLTADVSTSAHANTFHFELVD